jgi:flagellar hook-associated protein 3 FlgL
MRISTSTIFDLGVSSIQQQTSDMVKTQQQIASGRRILTPADDPVASARVLEVSQAKSLNQQYDVNTNSATSVLGMEDTVLGGVTNLLLDVHDAALTAQSPLMNHTSLSGLATGLRGRYQELLGLANSTDGNGQYLFSGYKGTDRKRVV